MFRAMDPSTLVLVYLLLAFVVITGLIVIFNPVPADDTTLSDDCGTDPDCVSRHRVDPL